MIPVLPTNLGPTLTTQSISPLRLLGEGDRALLEASIVPAKLPALVLGEQVSARIAEQLGNNQVAVLIKNALFTLTLPPGLQLKSDNLNLRVTSLKPGVTFALSESEQGAEHTDASVEVALSPASRYLMRLLSSAPQDDAGGQGTQSGKSGVGTDGKLLADTAANAKGTDAASLKAYGSTGESGSKLLAMLDSHASSTVTLDAKHPPEQVAQNLKQGVENSGLFYESHLKAWDQGKLSLAQLQQEPQAKVGQALAQGVDTPQGRAALPELGTLVQRQLNTLESQQVPLQGFAWPGQPMQMLIEQEKTEERQAHGESDAQAWSTQLSLNLPVLGGLSARLRMVGKAVQVSFVTEEQETEGLIQKNSKRLEDGLAAAGLSLATLSVKHE
jgi:hypothetical protein